MDISYTDWKRWFMLMLLMEVNHPVSASLLDITYTRVVQSPVLLICPTAVSDIETVRWKKDASTIPILSYFPKDDYIDPEDHDQRLSIWNDKDLMISSLEFTDSGNYTCVITSSTLPKDVTYVIQLKMKAGCPVPVFPDPLTTPNAECASGSTIGYKAGCNFTCPYGYAMIGDMSTECQANGSLSNDLPECAETSCYIDSMPVSPVKVEGCLQCSRVLYGHSCTFSCETGYQLVGAGVLTCLTTGDLDNPYPSCEAFKTGHEHNLLPLLVLIIIPVVIAGSVIFVCLRKKDCNRDSAKDVEIDEDVPLKEPDQHRNPKVTFGKDISDPPKRPALPRHLKDLFKGFRALLIDQLDMKKRPDILQRMHEIERSYILPKIHSIDVDEGLKEYIENFSLKKMSSKEAFALYITVLMSFIADKQMAQKAQHEIIAMTGHQDVKYSCINVEASKEQSLLDESNNTNGYLQIVLKAFSVLIQAERSSIDDKQAKNDQTSKVSGTILRFFEEHPENDKMENVSSRSKSTVQSFEASNADDEYFAKLCVKEIRQFDNLDHSVSLRHTILDVLFTQN